MKVKVTKESVCITESVAINENELNVNVCDFALPQCFQGLTVTAMFNNIPVPLTGTQCYIPSLESGTAILGVYAYKEDEDGELSLMYSPKPACFYVNKGSYSERINVADVPEISEFERYCASVSALTFPKSDVVGEIDLEGELNDGKVYSARALNAALAEVGELVGCVDEKITELRDCTEKISNKVSTVDGDSTDLQYPSAAAVHRGLSVQAERLEKAKNELASDIGVLGNALRFSENEMKAEVHRVEDRVEENAATISLVTAEQKEINAAISNAKRDITQLQESADALSVSVQNNKGDISQLNELSEVIQNDVRNLSESLEAIRESVNSRVFDNANSIKGVKKGTGVVEINDMSPLSHYLDITVSGEGASECTIACNGKNMLDFNGRTLADFDVSGHNFTGNNLFLSVSGNGYYKKNEGAYSYDASTHRLEVSCGNAWYGLGLDFKVSEKQNYRISTGYVSDNFTVLVSFYNSAGENVSFLFDMENKGFTIPAGVEWMIVIFTAKVKDVHGVYEYVQLEAGNAATEYQPYVEPQYAVPDYNGTIKSFVSKYPAVIVSSDNPAVIISCTYNRDTDKAYKELVNAITALGGSV